ncbi:MAG: hypothetical protein M1337_01025, partial [Actinobacteria bacterium]|nr:hypothetical protein [Actinomycetota bacterium]
LALGWQRSVGQLLVSGNPQAEELFDLRIERDGTPTVQLGHRSSQRPPGALACLHVLEPSPLRLRSILRNTVVGPQTLRLNWICEQVSRTREPGTPGTS